MPQAACTLSTLLFLCLTAGHFQCVFVQSQGNIARKFDEFGDIQESDLKARLDNFAIQVQSEKGTKGFILLEKRHLIDTYGVPVSRIRTIDGGYRKRRSVELWIVPAGEPLPIPTPNSFPPLRARPHN